MMESGNTADEDSEDFLGAEHGLKVPGDTTHRGLIDSIVQNRQEKQNIHHWLYIQEWLEELLRCQGVNFENISPEELIS